MKRVLFVDDEPYVLDGLRDLLRRHRSTWEMAFVTSGAAALDQLAANATDVVVTDMHMPGMDGTQLLTRIRDEHPATVRIALTGQDSKEDLLQLHTVAQQILSKPCDPLVLTAIIERVCTVQALLGNRQLQVLVGGLDRLPTFPRCYQQLCEAMQRDDASIAEIARIVERDPALSLRTLAMANAAYFGLARPTTSIATAVRHVGLTLLRALALSTDIFGSIRASLLASSTLRRLPERSLFRAQLARRYVLDRARADEAFTAALLIDIGMIVLGQQQPDEYLRLLLSAEAARRPVHELEFEMLGFTHAEVGAYLLGVWGLPASMVELVASHHAPALLQLSSDAVATAVHLADVFTDPTVQLVDAIRARPEISERLEEWQCESQIMASPAIRSA